MENQRVRMTKKLFADSLLSLMQTKPIQEISVSELCRQAQVNRTTFYKYYKCPQGILQDIASANHSTYARLCEREVAPSGKLNAALQNMLKNLDRARILNAETMRMMENGQSKTTGDDVFYRILSADLPPEMRRYCRVMTSAAMTVWLNDPDRMSTESFARLLLDISQACLRYANDKR